MTATPPPGQLAWAIAIPARNDADRIAECLAALARQRDVAMADGTIVVVACNSSDDTPRIARESRQLCALRVVQQNGADCSSRSDARRLALAHARRHVRDDGIVLMTDANVVVEDTWVAAMLQCFEDRAVDAVAGAIDDAAHDRHILPDIAALERRYWALMVAAEDAIDPQAHDPAPRHGGESGSNLAIRARMFDAVGGIPALMQGEVRALFDAVRARDGVVRHALAPHATAAMPPHVTPEESMASVPRHPLRSRIWWPAATVERRLALRREARAAYAEGAFARWAALHGVADWDAQAHFGSSWAGFLARSPTLMPTQVDVAALPAQIAMLEYLLDHAADRG